MKKILAIINNLDRKTIITVNLFLTVLLFIPLTIWLLEKPTRPTTRAKLPLPTSTLLKPTPTPSTPLRASPTPRSLPVTGLPEITSVAYFYGKVGDSVIIEGKNFGNTEETIFFNNTKADIIKFWRDDKIHVLVPKNAQSGQIRLKSTVSPYNFIVYDQKTTCELGLEKTTLEKKLWFKNCPLFDQANFILKASGPTDPEVIPNESLPEENVKTSKEAVDGNQIIKVEITVPTSFIPQELFKISVPDDEKVTIVACQLYANGQLLPLFVDPLNISN